MTNVKTKMAGKKLVIEVDLSERHGLSGSKKNEIIATTSGNVDIGDGIKMGLNIYTRPDAE